MLAVAWGLTFGLAGCTGTAVPDPVATETPVDEAESPDAAPLSGTTWGDGVAEFEFRREGIVVGDNGCNGVSFEWEQDGADIRFGLFSTTDIGCSGYEHWVEPPSAGEISDGVLTVRNQDGDVIVALRPLD